MSRRDRQIAELQAALRRAPMLNERALREASIRGALAAADFFVDGATGPFADLLAQGDHSVLTVAYLRGLLEQGRRQVVEGADRALAAAESGDAGRPT